MMVITGQACKSSRGSSPWKLNFSWRVYDPTGKYAEYNIYAIPRIIVCDEDTVLTYPDPQSLAQFSGVDMDHSKYLQKGVLHLKFEPGSLNMDSIVPQLGDFENSIYDGWGKHRYNCLIQVTKKSDGSLPTTGRVGSWSFPKMDSDLCRGITVTADFTTDIPGYQVGLRFLCTYHLLVDEGTWEAHTQEINAGLWHPEWMPTYHQDRLSPSELKLYVNPEAEHALNVWANNILEGKCEWSEPPHIHTDALSQFNVTAKSQVNWLENVLDIVDLGRDLKRGKLQKTLKDWKKYQKKWKGLGSIQSDIDLKTFSSTYSDFLKVHTAHVWDYGHEFVKDKHKLTFEEYLMKNWSRYGFSSPSGAQSWIKTNLKLFKRWDKSGLRLANVEDLGAKATSADILRSTSELWLSYRYLYLTTMMDLDEIFSGRFNDTLDVAADTGSRWQHCHATGRSDLYLGSNKVGTGTMQYHVWGRPHITTPIQEICSMNNAIGLVNLSNLWDVVPFSFIIDWFVGVGDFLDALDKEHALQMSCMEYSGSMDTFTWVIPVNVLDQQCKIHAYYRIPHLGTRGFDLVNPLSDNMRTWFRRVNDSVALLAARKIPRHT